MKNTENNGSPASSNANDAALLFLRIVTGAMLLTGVMTKSQNYIALADGYPSFWGIDGAAVVTAAGIVEAVCAVALITGLWIRYAAIVMAVVELGAAFLFFPEKTLAQGELNFVYAAILVYFAIAGGGRYALSGGYITPRRERK